jgi:uncharacterized protein
MAPPPVPDLESAPFWEACRARRLIVKTCRTCARAHYPPGPVCPWCTSFDLAWEDDPGLGRIHSHVIFRHPFVPELAEQLPYVVLRVRLDGHPDAILYGRLVGAAVESVRDGLPVEVDWEERPDGWVLADWRLAITKSSPRAR